MKKVLISILIVLLVVLAYFAIFNGLSLGNIRVLSVGEIIQANDELTNSIEQVNALIKKDYPAKEEELKISVGELTAKKDEYFKIAKVSTEGEITKANTEETYLIEYLWTRIGRHATSKGVNIRMDVNSNETNDANMKNLAFTVNGQYIGIIQFISALENDDKLNFKIENFKMIKNDTNLTASFDVKNIRIKAEVTQNSTEQAVQNNDATNGENVQANTVNDANSVDNTDNTTNIIDNITGNTQS